MDRAFTNGHYAGSRLVAFEGSEVCRKGKGWGRGVRENMFQCEGGHCDVNCEVKSPPVFVCGFSLVHLAFRLLYSPCWLALVILRHLGSATFGLQSPQSK